MESHGEIRRLKEGKLDPNTTLQAGQPCLQPPFRRVKFLAGGLEGALLLLMELLRHPHSSRLAIRGPLQSFQMLAPNLQRIVGKSTTYRLLPNYRVVTGRLVGGSTSEADHTRPVGPLSIIAAITVPLRRLESRLCFVAGATKVRIVVPLCGSCAADVLCRRRPVDSQQNSSYTC